MKCLLSVLALAVGIAMASSVYARDLIISRTLIKDPTGALTPSDVAHIPGTPVSQTLSLGSTKSVFWVRLQVHQPAHGTRIVLFIRPSYLNEVRLYEANSGSPSGWKTRVTGNHYPYRDRDRASVSLGFLVDVTAPTATYYLRLKTRSPLSIDVQAIEPEEADRRDHRRDLLEVFFVTSMVFLLFWAIHSFLLDRQRVVAWFALHQAVYTLFGIVATGYLAPFAPPNAPQLVDWLNAILYLGINFTLVVFSRELFKPYNAPTPFMRVFKVLFWTFPVLLAALVTGHDNFAILANSILLKLSLGYFVVVAFSLRSEGSPKRRVLQAFFLFILFTNVVFWSAGRFTRIGSFISLSAVQTLVIDGLVIGGLFAWILHTRARQALREGQQSAFELLLVQRKFEAEQELKRQIEIQAQTDYLTGVCNRRRLVELAESEVSRAIRFRRPLTLLVFDIDHFKKINDSWGHSAGDEVLQQVSGLIHDALRDSDIFGRTGGEEFAAILVETDGKEALEVAQRLCRIIADASIVPNGANRIPVSVSIGLTELGGRATRFSRLLDEADRAMYCAKQAGRNCVCVHDQVARII